MIGTQKYNEDNNMLYDNFNTEESYINIDYKNKVDLKSYKPLLNQKKLSNNSKQFYNYFLKNKNNCKFIWSGNWSFYFKRNWFKIRVSDHEVFVQKSISDIYLTIWKWYNNWQKDLSNTKKFLDFWNKFFISNEKEFEINVFLYNIKK